MKVSPMAGLCAASLLWELPLGLKKARKRKSLLLRPGWGQDGSEGPRKGFLLSVSGAH